MRAARSHAAQVFRALGDDTRLLILALLGVRAVCVCELVDVLGVSQPTVSEHLRRLRDVGLVSDERRGNWAFYRLAVDVPMFVHSVLDSIVLPKEMAARLAASDACAPSPSTVHAHRAGPA